MNYSYSHRRLFANHFSLQIARYSVIHLSIRPDNLGNLIFAAGFGLQFARNFAERNENL